LDAASVVFSLRQLSLQISLLLAEIVKAFFDVAHYTLTFAFAFPCSVATLDLTKIFLFPTDNPSQAVNLTAAQYRQTSPQS
jgi:hypothetical protein